MARLPRHLCALCLCVITLLLQCHLPSASDDVQPPEQFKQDSYIGIQQFLDTVKTGPVDLIILMERSEFVPRWWFYHEARKLVRYVLRYYVKMGPSNVRLVVATFATGFTWHINGMDGNITKCDILEKFWENVVIGGTPKGAGNVQYALEQAKNKFDHLPFRDKLPNPDKYIWLLMSGILGDGSNYGRNYDPSTIAETLRDMNVRIVTTKVGPRGSNEDIRQLATSANHHVESGEEWNGIVGYVKGITDPPYLVQSSTPDLCNCEQSLGFTICGECQNEPLCENGNTCTNDCICTSRTPNILCPKASPHQVCPIFRGKTGRYCQIKVKECVRGTCANNGTCHEGEGRYTCTCPRPYSPEFLCERSGPIKPDESVVGPAAGGAGSLTLIIIIVGGVCIWRKKRRPATQTADVNTTQNTPNTTLTIPSPRRERSIQEPCNISIGSYLQFQSLASSLPVSVIVDHEVTVATRADDDDDEGGDYENVGSKNMPGWETYVMKLATEGGLRNFAIMRYDREAYVTTCEVWLLPTKDELSHIYNVLLSRQTGEYVKIKSARYKVTKNNGKMMESWLEGRTPDVLCIGRSKLYLALGVETDRAKTGSCYQEVSWVRENLSKQGK